MIVKAKYLGSWKEKSDGLLKYKKAQPVYFKTRWGIHTFFMKFPIDVVILNNNYQVVKLKKSLKPNRVMIWNPKHFNILELPDGFIEKNKMTLGTKVKLDLI